MNVAMTCNFFLSVHSVLFYFLLSINRKGGKGTFPDSSFYKECNKDITLTNIEFF